MHHKLKNISIVFLLGLAGVFFGCQPKVRKPVSPVVAPPVVLHDISPEEVKHKVDAGDRFILLDVRTNEEYAEGHLKGATLIPLDQLDKHIEELDAEQEIVVYCRSGRRSNLAANMLLNMGFGNVKNMKGGIMAWPYEVIK
jgi:rhodanese-related sulfurtransferase